MLGGYTHCILFVNLTTGEISGETSDEALYRDFIGGYGIGARVLWDRMPTGADPLGPDNLLGFITGPLTGSAAPTGTRWTVVGKSPLTSGWGDASAGGYFGPALKAAGYDAIFFSGVADRPVYLFVDDGQAELRDAGHLWGQDSYEFEDWLKAEFGENAEGACIGPAGEKLSLISGIVHHKGRVSARSGLGAVMGSKRLKGLIVWGSHTVAVADPDAVRALQRKYLKEIHDGVGFAEAYRTEGTPGYTVQGAVSGDSPVRNWGGDVVTHFPDFYPLGFEELVRYRVKKRSCWHCPIGCWGTARMTFAGETFEAHQPEYETLAAFGSNCLNNDLASILKANDLCNRLGLDTISAGMAVSFALECYEHGLITKEDTGGLELAWGNPVAIVRLTEMIGRREGIGNLLADGVARAAKRLGLPTEPFAIHVGGQELPMHDSRFEPTMAVIYQLDATPGRHTQGCQYLKPPGFDYEMPGYGENRAQQTDRGRHVRVVSALTHTMNASGLCLFGYLSMNVAVTHEFIQAVTGRPFGLEEMLVTGERIANLRQAFNVREEINPLQRPMPARALGQPPLSDGPRAGVTVEIEQLLREHLEEMDWSLDAAVPSRPRLEALGLSDVADELEGSERPKK